jgi:hypothetical protein
MLDWFDSDGRRESNTGLEPSLDSQYAAYFTRVRAKIARAAEIT